jgi:TolB protein
LPSLGREPPEMAGRATYTQPEPSRMLRLSWLAVALLPACALAQSPAPPAETPDTWPRTGAVPFESLPGEVRLANVRKLTHGGQNAEAYFSADGRRLVFQSTPEGGGCDQIFVMDVDGRNLSRVSTGAGRTTCGYFAPSGDRVVYSSTHHRDAACPPPPDRSRGYVWPLHPYDVFAREADGTVRQLTDTPGYDAEATFSADGSRIVFTSTRDGDVELYSMDADGGDVRRLTFEEGYDGGAFFSPDGTQIVYRAHHPADPAELEDYRTLLRNGLVRPSRMDLWIMDADGGNKRQLTSHGAADFAPFFHPDGKRVIFGSNLHNPQGRDFELYLIGTDGTGLERITFHGDFDSFPMFSRDGRQLVWGSNRGGSVPGETNVFIADWIEDPAPDAEQ